MKICKCNKCGGIFEDMNPQTNAPEYQEMDVPSLVICNEDDAIEGQFWGCPVCKTDAYLSDDLAPYIPPILF